MSIENFDIKAAETLERMALEVAVLANQKLGNPKATNRGLYAVQSIHEVVNGAREVAMQLRMRGISNMRQEAEHRDEQKAPAEDAGLEPYSNPRYLYEYDAITKTFAARIEIAPDTTVDTASLASSINKMLGQTGSGSRVA